PLVPAVVELPADDVAVQQVPVRTGTDEGAALLPRIHHALGRQHAQRLADRGETDAQLVLQRHDVDGFALSEPTGQDPPRQFLNALSSDAACRVSRDVVAPPLGVVARRLLSTLGPTMAQVTVHANPRHANRSRYAAVAMRRWCGARAGRGAAGAR